MSSWLLCVRAWVFVCYWQELELLLWLLNFEITLSMFLFSGAGQNSTSNMCFCNTTDSVNFSRRECPESSFCNVTIEHDLFGCLVEVGRHPNSEVLEPVIVQTCVAGTFDYSKYCTPSSEQEIQEKSVVTVSWYLCMILTGISASKCVCVCVRACVLGLVIGSVCGNSTRTISCIVCFSLWSIAINYYLISDGARYHQNMLFQRILQHFRITDFYNPVQRS